MAKSLEFSLNNSCIGYETSTHLGRGRLVESKLISISEAKYKVLSIISFLKTEVKNQKEKSLMRNGEKEISKASWSERSLLR